MIELKYAERGDFAGACREALTQIEKRGYTETLELDGMETIIRYGIACFRKRCRVRKGTPESRSYGLRSMCADLG